jgi:hypothetical protein
VKFSYALTVLVYQNVFYIFLHSFGFSAQIWSVTLLPESLATQTYFLTQSPPKSMDLRHRDATACMPPRYYSTDLCRNQRFTSEMISSTITTDVALLSGQTRYISRVHHITSHALPTRHNISKDMRHTVQESTKGFYIPNKRNDGRRCILLSTQQYFFF